MVNVHSNLLGAQTLYLLNNSHMRENTVRWSWFIISACSYISSSRRDVQLNSDETPTAFNLQKKTWKDGWACEIMTQLRKGAVKCIFHAACLAMHTFKRMLSNVKASSAWLKSTCRVIKKLVSHHGLSPRVVSYLTSSQISLSTQVARKIASFCNSSLNYGI